MAQRQTLLSIANLTDDMWEGYAVAVFSKVWREMGIEVELGQRFSPEAKLCLLHYDQTKIEPSAIPTPPEGVQILNGRVLDISKRAYSSLRVTPDTLWAGPVIIKSDLNHFGVREAEASDARRPAWARLRQKLANRSWRLARMLPHRCYPVLPAMDDVPGWVWRDETLIVERFLPERTEDGLYGVRSWVFLGDRGYAYRNLGTDPLVKASSGVRTEHFERAPEQLIRFRNENGFDFGKFDYVEHGDDVFLLDANKTPTFSGAPAEISPRVRMLAEGIRAFL